MEKQFGDYESEVPQLGVYVLLLLLLRLLDALHLLDLLLLWRRGVGGGAGTLPLLGGVRLGWLLLGVRAGPRLSLLVSMSSMVSLLLILRLILLLILLLLLLSLWRIEVLLLLLVLVVLLLVLRLSVILRGLAIHVGLRLGMSLVLIVFWFRLIGYFLLMLFKVVVVAFSPVIF